jgi:hypothetical protein
LTTMFSNVFRFDDENFSYSSISVETTSIEDILSRKEAE